MATEEEIYMLRAFELAALGRGRVSPNPMVGCVIVRDGRILGEGFHARYGEAHAEVNAIRAVSEPAELQGADLYVTLEPCAHHGKTPPCADLIVQYPFRKVLVANTDPNPLVAGKGIARIRAAGIEVHTGLMANEGHLFNARFFTYMEKKRPYVILKWAQTSDGFIARENFDSKWISSALSRKWVHRWRSEEDAIMVGTRTVLHDNPELTTRLWVGRNPLRLFIDKKLELPQTLHLQDGSVPTLCYTQKKAVSKNNLEYVTLSEEGEWIPRILQDLYERKVQSVLVEGGAQLLQSFIDLNLWDEARVFVAEQKFERGIKAPVISNISVCSQRIHGDRLNVYYNQ